MEKVENIEKMTFSDYYNSLEADKKKTLREDFLNKTGGAYPTFYSKLSRNSFTNLEKEFLEKLCNQEFNW